jgi:hypothetical protein
MGPRGNNELFEAAKEFFQKNFYVRLNGVYKALAGLRDRYLKLFSSFSQPPACILRLLSTSVERFGRTNGAAVGPEAITHRRRWYLKDYEYYRTPLEAKESTNEGHPNFGGICRPAELRVVSTEVLFRVSAHRHSRGTLTAANQLSTL